MSCDVAHCQHPMVLPTTVAKVRCLGQVYIVPIVPIRNQVVFSIKHTSHPAHTSNLGKVGPVPYTADNEKKFSPSKIAKCF